jgi:nucleoside-diphosphate-sugar epimerase
MLDQRLRRAKEESMEHSGAQGETVLVTGGAGYLGSWCVVEALRRGYSVRATVRDLAREPAIRAAIAKEIEPGERLTVLAADLRHDAGWDQAVEGCDYVLHVASPLPAAQPKDADELIVPARDGTLRVLRAALDAGVKRVVVTSSVAAIMGDEKDPSAVLTEEDWADPDSEELTPYARSKTIAEHAAWDRVRERGVEEKLAAVNPSVILGPVLSDDRSFSLQLVERLLKGIPGIPRVGFSVVDVRDVADLQLRAMTAPEAGGERFIAAGPFVWMSEIAEILRARLGEAASKVPKRNLPNILVRVAGIFDSGLRAVAGQLGKRTDLSNEKARSRLGWSPRPVEETIVNTAHSLIREGVVMLNP